MLFSSKTFITFAVSYSCNIIYVCVGEPDTEEQHMRQLSPASCIDTQSSLATRSPARPRNKRHHSAGSDTAETPHTPKRKRVRRSATPSVRRSKRKYIRTFVAPFRLELSTIIEEADSVVVYTIILLVDISST